MTDTRFVILCPPIDDEEAATLRDRLKENDLIAELHPAPKEPARAAAWRAAMRRSITSATCTLMVEPSPERDPEGRYRRDIAVIFADLTPPARATCIACSLAGKESGGGGEVGRNGDGGAVLAGPRGRSVGDLGDDQTLTLLRTHLSKGPPRAVPVSLDAVGPVVLSDHAVQTDGMGLGRAVSAFVDLIGDKATKPPIVASIEGGWGVGKSSFLNLVRAETRRRGWSARPGKKPPEPERRDPPEVRTVWFNAWTSDGEASAFSAFGLALIAELESVSLLERLVLRLRLAAARFDLSTGWIDLARFVAGVLLVVLSPLLFWLGGPKLTGWVHDGVAWTNTAALGGTAALGWAGLSQLRRFFRSPFDVDLRKHVKAPDYEATRSQRDRLHDDIARIIDVYAHGVDRVYVFIDDLDRADPATVAEITQTIAVLLARAGQKLVYVLALDREKVAAAITAKHKEIAEIMSRVGPKTAQPLDFGQAFLEKLVQLPFRVPTPGAAEIRTWIEGACAVTTDLGEVVGMVAPFLGANPRRIKHFVNLLHLHLRILRAQEPSGTTLSLHQLGKITALEILYPFFVGDLIAAPALLDGLLMGAGPEVDSEAYRRWSAHSELLELLAVTRPADSPMEALEADRSTSLIDLDLGPVLRVVLRSAEPGLVPLAAPLAPPTGGADDVSSRTPYEAMIRYAREYERIRITEPFAAQRTAKLDRLFDDMARVRGVSEAQVNELLDSGSAGKRICALASCLAEPRASAATVLQRLFEAPKSPFETYQTLNVASRLWRTLAESDRQAIARTVSSLWLTGRYENDAPIMLMTRELLKVAEGTALGNDIQISLPGDVAVRLALAEIESFNELTDAVYPALTPAVRAYFYGTDWRLFDGDTPLRHARELNDAGPGAAVEDDRSLSQAGVRAGARLRVELLR